MGFEYQKEQEIYLFIKTPRLTQKPTQWVPGALPQWVPGALPQWVPGALPPVGTGGSVPSDKAFGV